MSDLPTGWQSTTVGEIATVQLGKMLDKANNKGEPTPYLRNINVRWGSVDVSDLLDMRMTKEDRAKFSIQDGDLLVCEGGEPGRAAIWRDGPTEIKFQKAIQRVRTSLAVLPEWLMHYFRVSAKNGTLQDSFTGTTIKHLPREALIALPVPLPPIPEQSRIVSKIDNLAGRSKRARDHLDHVPRLVEKYKQAVLDTAFEGTLTQKWRAENVMYSASDNLGEVRLRREKSRLALEQQKAKRSGQPALGDERRPFFRPRQEANDVPESDVPDSWVWISPDELASDARHSICIGPFGSNLVKSDYRDSGVPLVFVREIRKQAFGGNDTVYIDHQKAQELSAHKVSAGDVLITKMGDPPGDTAIYPAHRPPGVITADCIKLNVDTTLASNKYVLYCIQSGIVKAQIKDITKGVAHQKVSLENFRCLALPIAPLPEQAEIVRRIEAAFAWIDRLASEATSARKLIDHLDQAILSKAFRGELVPQNPNDEPASVLLERIRAERTVAKPAKGRRRAS